MDSGSAHDERVDQTERTPRLSLRSWLSTTPSWFRLAVIALCGGVLTIAVVVGVFFLVLSRGPIDLTWLAPEIVASLGDRAGQGYKFKLSHVSVTSSDHGPKM